MIDVDKLSKEISYEVTNRLPEFFKPSLIDNRTIFKFKFDFQKFHDGLPNKSSLNLSTRHIIDEILSNIYKNVFTIVGDVSFIDCIHFTKSLLYESKYIDECYPLFQSNVITNPKIGMYFSENPKFSYSGISDDINTANNLSVINKIGLFRDKNIFVYYYMPSTENKVFSVDEVLYDFNITNLYLGQNYIYVEYIIGFEFINKKLIYILTDKESSEYLDYISYKRDEKITKLLDERDC